MRRRRSLGLDELMIVNPGQPGAAPVFLGARGARNRRRGATAPGPYFLGADGMVYSVRGLGEGEAPGRYFLGEDGTLYELRGG
jgi:hypothetical protein